MASETVNLPTASFARLSGEPNNYAEINHTRGCISRLGCRCAAYSNINPQPPEYLRVERDKERAAHEELLREIGIEP